jgi:N-acetylmuramoyl-L-alanine amidase
MKILKVPSPNFLPGRRGYKPEAVIIHIMQGTLFGTDSWFQSAISKSSSHYGIGKWGEVHQYVGENDTAFHCTRINAPTWTGIKQTEAGLYINPDYYTVGIEHEGDINTEWSEEMYEASAKLIGGICLRWDIPADRDHIIGHHEVYSIKKCPGNVVDIHHLIALAQTYINAGAQAVTV